MRAILTWVVALAFVVSPAVAGTEPEKTAAASTTKISNSVAEMGNNGSSKGAAPAKPESPPMEVEIERLSDLIQAQAKELAAQRAALRQQQQKMQALEDQLKTADGRREYLSAAVREPESASKSGALASNAASTTETVSAEPRQDQQAAESPVAIRFKGITITPGGFLVAETAWRQRALSADVNTPFNSIPLRGNSQSQTTELNASGRQSRISLLAEGKLGSTKLTGYYEADFLSAGVTSNNNQSNSYALRQRQVWGQAALDSGWTFTGGQRWRMRTDG